MEQDMAGPWDSVENQIVGEFSAFSVRRHQDDSEDVDVRIVPSDDVCGLIDEGRIRHSASISGWHMYERSRRTGR
jgi:hypothetical protein